MSNNNLTELVFILDKSGSMAGKEEDTIGSFNSTIDKHKKNETNALVTTVLFSDNQTILHDRIGIKEIEPMNNSQYVTDGCTALIDAMGDTINHISDIHKYQRKEDIPSHTIFVIITDGLENASHKYSSNEVKKIVTTKEEMGWSFLFIGANIDAVETAKQFNIPKERAVNYHNDKKGIEAVYDFVAEYVEYEASMPEGERVSKKKLSNLRLNADKDYEERKKK